MALLSGLILAEQADGWQADYPAVIRYHLVVQRASLRETQENSIPLLAPEMLLETWLQLRAQS